MIQPNEMKSELPMEVANGIISSTTKVWNILVASNKGDLDTVIKMIADCPELIYAQYNYTPPIHFAVREGHLDLVKYLLDRGALDPSYRIYPFLDDLVTIARDRDYKDIVILLQQYLSNPERCKFKSDNGRISYPRNELQQEFEIAVDKGDLDKTGELLKKQPGFVLDETFFWGEGILMMPAKDGNRKMIELLMSYGARVQAISKWGQFYYFKHYEMAAFLLEKGMNPDHMTWHHVTLLHDMAQKGDIQKAGLLIKHGAAINPIEEEYQSTPLGMAARWGHSEMVEFLIDHGADPNKSGAIWATPLAWAKKKGYPAIEEILRKAGGH